MNELDCRKLIIKAGLELVDKGFIARTWGNISCRIDAEKFLITPSGRDYLTLKEDELVLMNISDLSFDGNIKPSSERGIHAEVYKIHPEVNFVIHTHQVMASSLSVLSCSEVNIHSENPKIDDVVSCSKYALPSTEKLCKNVMKSLLKKNGNTVLMENHGTMCFGENYEETFRVINDLEISCKELIYEKYLNLSGENQVDDFKLACFALGDEKQPREKVLDEDRLKVLKLWLKKSENSEYKINSSDIMLAMSNHKKSMRAVLDDFAQIVGRKAQFVSFDREVIIKNMKKYPVILIEGVGALCTAPKMHEAEAVSMVAEKNCWAYVAGSLFGQVKHLGLIDATLMRFIFKKSYSKRVENNKAR